MTAPSPMDRARRGDVEAIAFLIRHGIGSESIQVQVTPHAHVLHIQITSNDFLEPDFTAYRLQNGLRQIQPPQITRIHLSVSQPTASPSHWERQFNLFGTDSEQPQNPAPHPVVDSPVSEIPPSPTPVRARSQSPAPLPRKPPQRDLGWMVVEHFDWWKMLLVGILTWHTLFSSAHYTVRGFLAGEDFMMNFLHRVDLIFHEAGHTLLIFFGQFIYILGGSLMQIAIPAVLAGYFWLTQQRYASAIALWWVGQNFLDVSIYIKDARAQELPLLGGEGVIHDWNFLLTRLLWLAHDQAIGNGVYAIGIVIYLVAIGLGVYFSQTSLSAKARTIPHP